MCEVTRVDTLEVLCPYAVVNPYSTCVSADSLVFQLMVAAMAEMELAVTALIVGGVVSAGAPKVAVILAVEFTVHVVDTVQPVAPCQPAKVLPPVGVAVKVTVVPLVYVKEQVVPQFTPTGLLVTVPVPEPPLVTEIL